MSDPVVLLSTGDVVGPAGGVTDNSMVLFSGTSGKLVKGNNAVVTAAGLALLDDVNAAAQRTTLGLGTAATAKLTTSGTDTTAGRVMKVGDFGLGAALNLSGQDLNDTDLATGMYYCVAPVNGPGANGHLWQHLRSSTVIAQYYVTASGANSKTYFRSMNGTWSVWREIALTDSPAFTGIPTAPTASVGTSTTQVATTAFVNAEIANDAPTKTGGGASGSWGISITGSAASASAVAWSGVSGKPTTLGGYGITDALSIWGGVVNGKTSLQKAGQVDYTTASVEIGATDGGQAILSFHRHGVEANTIRLNGGFYFDTSVTVYGAVNATNLLGQGQTWQNVTGSRAKNTTYTNSTGRPIQLYITGDLNTATLTIGGVALASQDYNGATIINTIIPDNTTYSLTWGGSAPSLWAELR